MLEKHLQLRRELLSRGYMEGLQNGSFEVAHLCHLDAFLEWEKERCKLEIFTKFNKHGIISREIHFVEIYGRPIGFVEIHTNHLDFKKFGPNTVKELFYSYIDKDYRRKGIIKKKINDIINKDIHKNINFSHTTTKKIASKWALSNKQFLDSLGFTIDDPQIFEDYPFLIYARINEAYIPAFKEHKDPNRSPKDDLNKGIYFYNDGNGRDLSELSSIYPLFFDNNVISTLKNHTFPPTFENDDDIKRINYEKKQEPMIDLLKKVRDRGLSVLISAPSIAEYELAHPDGGSLRVRQYFETYFDHFNYVIDYETCEYIELFTKEDKAIAVEEQLRKWPRVRNSLKETSDIEYLFVLKLWEITLINYEDSDTSVHNAIQKTKILLDWFAHDLKVLMPFEYNIGQAYFSNGEHNKLLKIQETLSDILKEKFTSDRIFSISKNAARDLVLIRCAQEKSIQIKKQENAIFQSICQNTLESIKDIAFGGAVLVTSDTGLTTAYRNAWHPKIRINDDNSVSYNSGILVSNKKEWDEHCVYIESIVAQIASDSTRQNRTKGDFNFTKQINLIETSIRKLMQSILHRKNIKTNLSYKPQ